MYQRKILFVQISEKMPFCVSHIFDWYRPKLNFISPFMNLHCAAVSSNWCCLLRIKWVIQIVNAMGSVVITSVLFWSGLRYKTWKRLTLSIIRLRLIPCLSRKGNWSRTVLLADISSVLVESAPIPNALGGRPELVSVRLIKARGGDTLGTIMMEVFKGNAPILSAFEEFTLLTSQYL